MKIQRKRETKLLLFNIFLKENGICGRAIEPQLVIWRWIALRKGNESLAGTKKKEKMNKDRSSVPTFIKEKIMWARSIIHFSSSFMCRLARLMIGTVKKRLSLDPAHRKERKAGSTIVQCLSSSLDSYHLLEHSFLFLNVWSHEREKVEQLW